MNGVFGINSNVVIKGSGTSSDPWYINPTIMASLSSPASCSISVSNPTTYETSKTLTASITWNGASAYSSNPYYWSNIGSWGTATTTTASSAGAYQFTLKDSSNLTKSCSVTLVSQQEYQVKTCTNYGQCYGCPNGGFYQGSLVGLCEVSYPDQFCLY